MKLIPLSKNGKNKGKYFAQVDDEDYEYLMQWNWYANKSSHGMVYAYSKKKKLMHRVIMNAKPSDIIDHANRNGLNNQKCNLRFCTYSQNGVNKGVLKTNTSNYMGVVWLKKRKKWIARVQFKGKLIHVGHFSDKIEAAKARDKKAIEIYGEFATLNFPI